MRASFWIILAVAGIAAVGVAGAQPTDECVLHGDVTVQPNPDDPALGVWKYCLEATWQIDPPHGVSHTDLLLALMECECVCEEFPFAAQDSAGYSDGVDSQEQECTVYYYAEFLCQGDPSIDLYEPLVKFEPYEGDCEPGVTGSGLFCFYSDWPPIPVPEENNLLVTKAGQVVCTGTITGFLPECSCGSSPQDKDSWGAIKARFRE